MNTHSLSNSVGMQSLCSRPLLIIGLFGLLLMTGCSNKDVVNTVDDSADYRSARSLPPLKKPSRNQSLPSANDEVASEPQDVVLEEAAPMPTTMPESSFTDESSVAAVESDVSETAIAASVVANDDGESFLQIDAPFEQAWEYLADSLQKSDVTIFARNEAAGRFSIGCGDIKDDKVTVQKRGGWSIFTRDKPEELEYCALQVVEQKNQALVSVLNRSGEVVSAASSNSVFKRILNN